jgi:hypothetical protein
MLYQSLPGRRSAGSLFPLALSDAPLAVTDDTNVYQLLTRFFKNVTVFGY